MATFVVSAFWHGFYPSYYVMFVFAAVLSEINKDIFKSKVIFNQYIPPVARSFAGHVGNMLAMNYFGIVFQALTFERTGWFLSQTYAFVFISLIVLLGYLRTTNIVGRAKKVQAKKDAIKNDKTD
jgi:hypothetical protein